MAPPLQTSKEPVLAAPTLSVVVPLLDEEDNVTILLDALVAALAGIDHEVILVDDGSTDQTIARALGHQVPNVLVVEMMKNYGQTSAMAAGIALARGEYVVTLDGDMQNDPIDIPRMLHKAQTEKWDVVAGRRANRQDGLLLRKVPSRLANALIRKLTGVYLYDYGCTLKVFKTSLARNLGLYGELHRFIPVLAAIQGARMVETDVTHHPRRFGTSKYGLGRTFKVLSDLLLMIYFQRFFKKPMHLFGPIGGGMFLVGLLTVLYQLLASLGGGPAANAATIIGLLLLLGGFLTLVVGLLAEIQMRIYYESRQKTPYSIREVHRSVPRPHPLTTG